MASHAPAAWEPDPGEAGGGGSPGRLCLALARHFLSPFVLAGNLSQSSATDLRKRCSQLEGHSDTWAGSSLRRTFSFLLGMTGKAKASHS
ncbi:hypothetical protein P7K49_037451 [Saguinus oedipus]|uniref:Uncharacterized protein n=1 Tax=Saguinus oedipus TaxID=9490 RepID=A0ABQ9TI50_SAGOE|nr:hypothetical protein P7K49_037451 [Saguinus oedipus]